jgi:hypothetical protein
MTNSEQIASLAAEIAALKARVDRTAPENAPEPDLRSRLSAEREQRKAALEAKKFANPRRGVTVTSDLRQEQIARTNTKLQSPVIPLPNFPPGFAKTTESNPGLNLNLKIEGWRQLSCGEQSTLVYSGIENDEYMVFRNGSLVLDEKPSDSPRDLIERTAIRIIPSS